MKNIIKNIDNYYSNKLKKYGPTPQGVDWNGEKGQLIRFNQLSKVIKLKNSSLNDIGCGYGKYAEYIANHFKNIQYTGYDLSKGMVNEATKLYPQNRFIHILNLDEIEDADYSIASGIFNVKLKYSNSKWLSYILNSLRQLNLKSKKGFSFNILTKQTDKVYMKNHLYYADPLFLYDYCIQHFSKSVTLKKNYNLYEFTILIKKN
jgi:SAM-dependent methyltransferase